LISPDIVEYNMIMINIIFKKHCNVARDMVSEGRFFYWHLNCFLRPLRPDGTYKLDLIIAQMISVLRSVIFVTSTLMGHIVPNP
jgi:hypothetical protein